MTLKKQFIDLMRATAGNMHDNGQRSALGIVDSYLRGGKVDPIDEVKMDGDIPLNRDSLAAVLMGMCDDYERAEASAASHAARDFINAPYANDSQLLAWREQRASKGQLGALTGEK